MAVVVLVGGVAAGAAAFADSGDQASHYRVAAVTRGDVTQTLSLTGTASSKALATESFPVSGTVAKVAVAVGDSVTAGDTLATLDTTSLKAAVIAAKATLAQAEAALASDESGSTSATTASETSGGAVTATTIAYVTTAASRPSSSPSLASAEAAVTNATKAVTTAEAAVVAATKTESTACAPAGGSGTAPSDLAACLSAITAVTTAQQTLATDQAALSTAQTALTKAIAAQASTSSGSSAASGSTSSSGTRSSGSGSGGTGGGSNSSSNSSSNSVQRTASDEASVASAKTGLATAEADLTAATLKAAISGTVGAISYTAGSASGSGSITVVGKGAAEVTVQVPLASLSSVKKGEAATVQGAGDATGVSGTVESVSLLPTSGTSSTSTYAVQILVPTPTASMADGSTVSAAITIASVKDVVSVPNSAVSTLAKGTATVEVIKDGKAVRTLVKTGAVGPTSTQVTSGLSVGQQVVIADLSAALPTTSSTTSRFGNRSSGLTSSLSGSAGLGGGPAN